MVAYNGKLSGLHVSLSIVSRPNNTEFCIMVGLNQKSVAVGPGVESKNEISV